MVNIYERLSSQIEAEVNGNYIDESILEMFTPINLEDISISEWVHKQLKNLPEAALTKAGYNPSKGTLFAEEFAHSVFSASEEISLNEKDWAFAVKHGIATMGLGELGKKVGKGASRFFMTACDGAGNAIEGNTNCLTATGSGTLTAPYAVTEATAGAWATWASQNTDITALVANYETKNYNLATAVCFYPKCASKSIRRHGANTLEHSALEHLTGMGIPCVAIPDIYLKTAAGATPVIGAFDLYLIDMSKIKIGYTRTQRTRTIAPHDEKRDTVIQSEVWFVPYFIPQPIEDTMYKGISRITAINGA